MPEDMKAVQLLPLVTKVVAAKLSNGKTPSSEVVVRLIGSVAGFHFGPYCYPPRLVASGYVILSAFPTPRAGHPASLSAEISIRCAGARHMSNLEYGIGGPQVS